MVALMQIAHFLSFDVKDALLALSRPAGYCSPFKSIAFMMDLIVLLTSIRDHGLIDLRAQC